MNGVKRAVYKFTSAASLLLGMSQVFVLLGGAQGLLWGLLASVLAVAAGLSPGRWRLPCGLAGLALFGACAALWMTRGWGLLLLAPCALIYYLVLRYAAQPPFAEWPFSWWLAGGLLHFMGLLAARFMAQDLMPLLSALCLAYIPVLLLQGNRTALSVNASARDGRLPPRRIRTANRILVLIVSAVIVAAANIRALANMFYALLAWLAARIGAVFAWLSALLAMDTIQSEGPSVVSHDGLPTVEPSETALFWRILEKAAVGLAIIALIALIIFGALALARAIKKLSQKLLDRMRESLRGLGEGVQEKSESILDWQEIRDSARQRAANLRKRMRPAPQWATMNNRQRVRVSFAQLRKKRPPQSPGATARETLDAYPGGSRLADIYDAARYSEHEINDQDAALMREAARREE